MRTSLRMAAAVAAACAATLLVAGCGSGDGGDEKPAAEETQNHGGDPETRKEPGSVQGIWKTKADGQDHVLTIVADGVNLTRGNVNCNGRMMDGGKQTINLTCPDGGGQERSNGTVERVDSEELEIAWNGGMTDTYARVADAPKDMPTDLGDLEDLEDLIPQG
ncbi:hypothetical protein [Streptomyces sp. JJ38]|uniref:hypothetical protein n=1 Tax=Streptomyces sp. JJ38 TaxID=2738128 RepID=UPI001C56F0CD|nr:hypothetical protein [Streptomyces sp. JJ38]MBW1600056.1 hypothetical protein [Streptomyces sp. JJ38]